MICYTACYLIMAVLPAGDFTAYLTFCLRYRNATYWTLIYSMSYDTALIEKFKSGNSPDGLYTSMIGFFMKAGSNRNVDYRHCAQCNRLQRRRPNRPRIQ